MHANASLLSSLCREQQEQFGAAQPTVLFAVCPIEHDPVHGVPVHTDAANASTFPHI